MKLISLNVGKPQPYFYKGKKGYTSIFKHAVDDERKVSEVNIEGDEQSDLNVHGGSLKSVYAYDVSYYEHWKNILLRDSWNYGLFGENLTTEGLADDTICIGDLYRIGSVVIKAIQPRFPCFKLNVRFNSDDIQHRFVQERRNGTYFSIVQEGTLKAGDEIVLIEQSKHKITIQQLVDSYYDKGGNKEVVEQILNIDFLPRQLRKAFESFAK